MADTIFPIQNGLFKKLKDMGDGTWAEIVAGILTAGENFIGFVGGKLTTISVELTKSASITAYTAGTVLSNSATTTTPMVFTDLFRTPGGSGYIVKIKCVTNKKSITPRLRVHFFNAADPTVAADGAAYKELYADTTKRLGYYDLPEMTTASDSANSDMSRTLDKDIRFAVNAAAASKNLYVVMEVLDIVTLDASEKFTLSVTLDNN